MEYVKDTLPVSNDKRRHISGDRHLHDTQVGTWFQGQWGAILASTLAGFGTAVLMATLGAAIGMTTGAAIAGETLTSTEAAQAGTGMALGAMIWIAITAIAVGVVAGTVLGRLARVDRAYSPVIFGTLSWAGGIALALLIASPGTSGIVSGLSGTGAVAASGAAQSNAGAVDQRSDSVPTDPAALSTEARQDLRVAAEKAAAAAAVAAWTSLISLVLALAATIVAAGMMRKHVIPVTSSTSRTGSSATFART